MANEASVRVRLTSEEKAQLEQLAQNTGLDMSKLIRSAVFSKQKLVFLVKGKEIAASLFQIHKDLEQLCSESVIPASEIGRLEAAMNEVAAQLRAVAEQLTDIHELADDEEGNDETS